MAEDAKEIGCKKTSIGLSEREVKQLLKLLYKFDKQDKCAFRRGIIAVVQQWVRWYGRDELNMDL